MDIHCSFHDHNQSFELYLEAEITESLLLIITIILAIYMLSFPLDTEQLHVYMGMLKIIFQWTLNFNI